MFVFSQIVAEHWCVTTVNNFLSFYFTSQLVVELFSFVMLQSSSRKGSCNDVPQVDNQPSELGKRSEADGR